MSEGQIRRSAERFVTRAPGRVTRHSFSFGTHYDPANVALGELVCHNEDVLEPGHGYDEHEHRGVEILTWVLSGALGHEDSAGHRGVVRPGEIQHLDASTPVRHREWNASDRDPVHVVQMWLRADPLHAGHHDPRARYQHRDVGVDLRRGGWVTLASGLASHADVTALRLANSRAALHSARLQPGASRRLPDAPVMHLFVARGGIEVKRVGGLDAGDAARLVGAGGQGVFAPAGAEVLLWEMVPAPH